jgi:DNA modification methylase
MINIKTGNCLDVLKELPKHHFHTVVTSPPYYGLRDYNTGTWIGGDPNCPHKRLTKISKDTATGHANMYEHGDVVGDAIYRQECPICGAKRQDDQIGLELTPQDYVSRLVEVFRGVRDTLRDDGTVWLNLGDSYHNYRADGGSNVKQSVHNSKHDQPESSPHRANKIHGLKQKDLMGIPWKVAFALQEDGWYLRQDIIWHKPNPMPESVKDRCTKSHEYIFLLSKSPNYYFDYEAIQEEAKDWGTRDRSDGKYHNEGTGLSPHTGLEKSYETKNKRSVWKTKYKDDEEERTHRQGMSKTRGEKLIATRPNIPSQEDFVKFMRSKTNVKTLSESTSIERTTIEHWFRSDKSGFSYPSRDDWIKISDLVNDWSPEYDDINERMTYEEFHFDDVVTTDKKNKRSVWTVTTKPYKDAHFATYPPDLIEPCIKAGCPKDGHVLDPFGGSGTTALVADRLNRNATVIELNKDYVDIAQKRIMGETPMFTQLQVD